MKGSELNQWDNKL